MSILAIGTIGVSGYTIYNKRQTAQEETETKANSHHCDSRAIAYSNNKVFHR